MWGCLTVLGVTKQILAFQGIKGSVFFLGLSVEDGLGTEGHR